MARFVSQLVGGKGMEDLRAQLARPFADGRGEAVAREVMWSGPGSTADQFDRREGRRGAQVVPWDPTQPFGRVQPGPSTLVRSGKYRAAWTGGEGSTFAASDTRVAVGVDPGRFPQVYTFQADREVRIPRSGEVSRAQFLALGLLAGVWLGPGKRVAGLRVKPRPVGIGPEMAQRAQQLVVSKIMERNRALANTEKAEKKLARGGGRGRRSA